MAPNTTIISKKYKNPISLPPKFIYLHINLHTGLVYHVCILYSKIFFEKKGPKSAIYSEYLVL